MEWAAAGGAAPAARLWTPPGNAGPGRYRAEVATQSPLPWDESRVEVRRSRRRARTVSAYRKGERTVVLVPDRLSPAEERRWVASMLQRLAAQEERRRPDESALLPRAAALSQRYLGGRARPSSVRWVTNQGSRWGSCTPASGAIRLSSRLQGMPEWVVDYVLVHELAHLLVPSHGAAFWRLVSAYPRTERARGYLEGAAAGAGLEPADEDDDVVAEPG